MNPDTTVKIINMTNRQRELIEMLLKQAGYKAEGKMYVNNDIKSAFGILEILPEATTPQPVKTNEDILVKALEEIKAKYDSEEPVIGVKQIVNAAISSYRTSVNENAKCDDWINVKDKLPGYDTLVLWYPVVGNMFIDMLDKDGSDWLDHCLFWKYITYEPDVDTESEQYKKATSAYEKFTSNSSSTSVKGEEQEKDDQIKLWEEIAKKVGGFNDFREWVEKFTEQYTLIKKPQS